jgi:hypothetical protein
MGENFLAIQKEYLLKAWSRQHDELEKALPAQRCGKGFYFRAFGEPCQIRSQEIFLNGKPLIGPEGVLIALYAIHVSQEPVQLHPLKSFKELPESMPYQGAFATNAEQILSPYVVDIQCCQQDLVNRFSGHVNADAPSGDFSFTLIPLPRVPLYYIFYLPDEEFPASVTCLFSANAIRFLPVAGLADVAEYTARKMINLVRNRRDHKGPGLP